MELPSKCIFFIHKTTKITILAKLRLYAYNFFNIRQFFPYFKE